MTAAHCMRYQCFSPPHFLLLQVKLKKGVMKYLEYSDWGSQRSAFLSLRVPQKLQVHVDLDVILDVEIQLQI